MSSPPARCLVVCQPGAIRRSEVDLDDNCPHPDDPRQAATRGVRALLARQRLTGPGRARALGPAWSVAGGRLGAEGDRYLAWLPPPAGSRVCPYPRIAVAPSGSCRTAVTAPPGSPLRAGNAPVCSHAAAGGPGAQRSTFLSGSRRGARPPKERAAIGGRPRAGLHRPGPGIPGGGACAGGGMPGRGATTPSSSPSSPWWWCRIEPVSCSVVATAPAIAPAPPPRPASPMRTAAAIATGRPRKEARRGDCCSGAITSPSSRSR